MLRSAAFASSVVASIPIVLPCTSFEREHLEDPVEDGLVRLHIDPVTSLAQRGMFRRPLLQLEPEKLAQREPVCVFRAIPIAGSD